MKTADLENLPDSDVLAAEIIENIESGLNSFREIMETINGNIRTEWSDRKGGVLS